MYVYTVCIYVRVLIIVARWLKTVADYIIRSVKSEGYELT